MDMYFNPYPGAAKSIEDGTKLLVKTADTFYRLKDALQNITLSGASPDARVDTTPSQFILIREPEGSFYGIKDVLFKLNYSDRTKVKLLLELFSRGKVIEPEDIEDTENWVAEIIGAGVPLLEIAAKCGAIALTVPTEPEWRVDTIKFLRQNKSLHNLWGQDGIEVLKEHCINSLRNATKRFAVRFGAVFCDGSLNSAPDECLWEKIGFFSQMEKARKRGYEVDDDLIKNVGSTKFGTLLELRCYGEGHRILFVLLNRGDAPRVLVGGFYRKSGGADQNAAIVDARKRVNFYREKS
jgi:hypothetical protein